MRKWIVGTLSMGLIGVFLFGCTTTQKGAAAGGAVGALAGQAIGRDTKGTLIGAGVGALAGALAGDAYESEKQRQAQQVPPTAPPAAYEPPRESARFQPGSYQADPTRGEFANKTHWEVSVWVDSDPNRTSRSPALLLKPKDTIPANLDVGQHRIYAEAFVDTQYGRRIVGRYDRVMNVDVKSNGWYVEFYPGAFD